jgi:hypothetical protein
VLCQIIFETWPFHRVNGLITLGYCHRTMWVSGESQMPAVNPFLPSQSVIFTKSLYINSLQRSGAVKSELLC